jgi:hypothetical protein
LSTSHQPDIDAKPRRSECGAAPATCGRPRHHHRGDLVRPIAVTTEQEKTTRKISDVALFTPPGLNGANPAKAASSIPSSQSTSEQMQIHPSIALTSTFSAPAKNVNGRLLAA